MQDVPKLGPLHGRLHNENTMHDMSLTCTYNDASTTCSTGKQHRFGTKNRATVRTWKKSNSGGTTATDPSVEIDIPTDDVMTTSTSATNDAWKAITETGMNEIIPGVGPEKGRQASREPELPTQPKERIFSHRRTSGSNQRIQPRANYKHRGGNTRKPETGRHPPGNLHITDQECKQRRVKWQS